MLVTPITFYARIPSIEAVRFDAGRGAEFARGLAKWAGGTFVFDDRDGHRQETYSWLIRLGDSLMSEARAAAIRDSGIAGAKAQALPGDYIIRLPDGTFGAAVGALFDAQFVPHGEQPTFPPLSEYA